MFCLQCLSFVFWVTCSNCRFPQKGRCVTTADKFTVTPVDPNIADWGNCGVMCMIVLLLQSCRSLLWMFDNKWSDGKHAVGISRLNFLRAFRGLRDDLMSASWFCERWFDDSILSSAIQDPTTLIATVCIRLSDVIPQAGMEFPCWVDSWDTYLRLVEGLNRIPRVLS